MNDFDNNVIQYFSEDAKVLIMSGTHGDPPESGSHSGVSGLTDKDLLVHHFYKEDCELVGIVPGPNRNYLPINWEGERETLLKHADITRKPERMENPSDESFAKDELVQNMDTRVASLSYYFGHTQKLLDDISKVSLVKILRPGTSKMSTVISSQPYSVVSSVG